MTEPLVCAIMLARDRPQMAARAVAAFRAQTYQNAWLLVYNTGEDEEIECGCGPKCYHVKDERARSLTIGALRNRAMLFKGEYHQYPDIVVHWDDDDLSHPNRIAEQVALLQASGADCVGYNEVLFWRAAATAPWATVHCKCGERYPRSGAPCPNCHTYPEGEAWLYRNPTPTYAIGSSLCYWRRTWERSPFADVMRGEDDKFIKDGKKVVGVSAVHDKNGAVGEHQPRLVCSIHGGNTEAYDIEDSIRRGGTEWRRASEWDAYARERMAL